ncbi:DUF3298 and DUF4163 domain-containing protein [Aquimarina sp. MMG016]|uniref:DUF3298 and DUF4163 domain-containing protein n=1 Tax=Aquimarina sp. MMG016 TaxID=2822690 RepID=UPI001B3A4870|nr:DUF3298 and DUF4163 domain-containing protein [Aquimarina sp. MMG016]MBQ4822028.1 DUF3298 and DUF4163 domain-containing protein [Aquimarina sp. MMG016]
MINTKPNISLTTIFLLLIFTSFYNCNTKESYIFEKQRFDAKTIIDCEGTDCASLEINLIQSINDNSISAAINKEIESVACAILNIGENDPEENIENAINEFNFSFLGMKKRFPEETVPYEATIDCDLSCQNENMISIIMDSYVFTGGAHGYGGVSYINIDAKTGKRISNRDLFKKYKEFESYAEKAFRTQHDISKDKSINSTGFFFENDTFSLPSTIGFTDKEVVLLYNSYEISSYAEGPIELKLKKQDVASFFAFEIE